MQMKFLRIALFNVAILAGLTAIMSVPAADRAEAAWCPGWMEQYCVLSRDGVEFVAWTKPCFARQEALRILHPGLCHGIGPHGRPY
jgi:hypothetical protein